MKVLILNGTHQNKYQHTLDSISNTYKSQNHSVKILNLEQLNLNYCIGCWSCWFKTPGKCFHNDDTPMVLKNAINSDLVVFFSENTLGFVNSLTKNVQDKLIPLVHPYVELINGELHHRKRYQKYPYIGLIFMDKAMNKTDFDITKEIYLEFAADLRTKLAFACHSCGKEDISYEDICI